MEWLGGGLYGVSWGGEDVVVKFVGLDGEDGDGFLSRVESLGRLEALAECDGVGRYVGCGMEEGSGEGVWVATERVDGGSVGRWAGRLREEALGEVVKGVVESLECLHGVGVAHGDLHAGNVLVRKVGEVVLTDYGVGEYFRRRGKGAATVVHPPWWTAPELLFEDGVTASVAALWSPSSSSMEADIWSIGTLLIELAEGRPPLSDLHPDEAVQGLLDGTLSPSLRSPAKWSTFMSDLIAKCLSKLPSARPTLAQIKEHDFLRGADPVALRDAIQAPPSPLFQTEALPPENFPPSELERIYRNNVTIRVPYFSADAFPPESFHKKAKQNDTPLSMLPALITALHHHKHHSLLTSLGAGQRTSQYQAKQLEATIRNIKRK